MLNLKTISVEGHAYFITTRVACGIPLFINDSYCQVIIKNFNFYRKLKQFKLVGYVIMPTHLHYIIWPVSRYCISEILRDFKKQTAKDIIKLLKYDKRVGRIINPTPCGRSGIRNPAHSLEARRLLNIFYKNSVKQEYRIWRARNWTVNIYSDKFLDQKIEYIHQNPVKAGFVKDPVDWKYSSARNYCLDDKSVIKINRI